MATLPMDAVLRWAVRYGSPDAHNEALEYVEDWFGEPLRLHIEQGMQLDVEAFLSRPLFDHTVAYALRVMTLTNGLSDDWFWDQYEQYSSDSDSDASTTGRIELADSDDESVSSPDPDSVLAPSTPPR
jgi:hypothetical protein